MTSGDELLNCPFCGGAAEVREWDFPYVRFQARCVECKTTGRTRFNERAKAIAAWNHRTPPTPAAEEREAVARAIAASYYHMDDCELSWQMTAECGEIEAMFRKADAALSALRKTRAAEILAAEANERARILSDAAIEAAREYLALCGHEPISDIFIEGAIKEAIKAGERNEHGAGK